MLLNKIYHKIPIRKSFLTKSSQIPENFLTKCSQMTFILLAITFKKAEKNKDHQEGSI